MAISGAGSPYHAVCAALSATTLFLLDDGTDLHLEAEFAVVADARSTA
jgi:hypothetical protein